MAPPWFEIPPAGYGGIERVCAELVDGLVEQGHDTTLIAVGKSQTTARFLQALPAAPPGLGDVEQPVQEVRYAAHVARLLRTLDVDLVHDHCLAAPLAALGRREPTLVTAHGPTGGALGDYFRALGLPIVAISAAQRRDAPDLPWLGMVHNAVDVDRCLFSEVKDDRALFLGRCALEKSPHLALDAAARAGCEIVLAGKCAEPEERRYFAEHVEHRLGPGAQWMGETGGAARAALLAHARCLVVPITWEEPFGLVAVEALAAGTPVVAFARGALPELVEHGRTGWLCRDLGELAEGIRRAGEIDPHECRAEARRRFHTTVMTAGYERVYRQLVRVGKG